MLVIHLGGLRELTLFLNLLQEAILSGRRHDAGWSGSQIVQLK